MRCVFLSDRVAFCVKILLEALMFLIPLGCDNWSDFCSDLHHFDLAVFVHSGFWFLELCFDRFALHLYLMIT